MASELVARCGKKGFKNPQGLQGHERMCPKCIALAGEKFELSKEKKKKEPTGECEHNWRLLTQREQMLQRNGIQLGSVYVAVCTKCEELK